MSSRVFPSLNEVREDGDVPRGDEMKNERLRRKQWASLVPKWPARARKKYEKVSFARAKVEGRPSRPPSSPSMHSLWTPFLPAPASGGGEGVGEEIA